MTTLRSDMDSVQIRDQVVLDTLRENPWSTTRGLSTVLLEETGGAPAFWTGAIYLPPHKMYPSLIRLEKAGKIKRYQFSQRTILWACSEEDPFQ